MFPRGPDLQMQWRQDLSLRWVRVYGMRSFWRLQMRRGLKSLYRWRFDWLVTIITYVALPITYPLSLWSWNKFKKKNKEERENLKRRRQKSRGLSNEEK
jgi:hypothetical protein